MYNNLSDEGNDIFCDDDIIIVTLDFICRRALNIILRSMIYIGRCNGYGYYGFQLFNEILKKNSSAAEVVLSERMTFFVVRYLYNLLIYIR